jgi:putative oxidoreductase
MSTGSVVSDSVGAAAKSNDLLLLIGRVLVVSVFALTAVTHSPNAGYLTALHYPSPLVSSILAIAVEWVVSVSLVFGIATRYGALLALLYVVIAASTAHRYWEFPQAQQTVQYIFATKDLSILGGLIMVFVTGAGRYSIDAMFWGKR